MLKRGFLSSDKFYASIAHDNDTLDKYFNSLDDVYNLLSKYVHDINQVKKMLDNPIRHSGFKRLN